MQARLDSNQGPSVLETDILPTELRALVIFSPLYESCVSGTNDNIFSALAFFQLPSLIFW